METGKENTQAVNTAEALALSSEEMKRLTDLFSILIEIDKRVIKAKKYGK